MLWNWDTVDACFLTRSWHIRSAAGFAGTCILIVALVIFLEALRRVAHEYEEHIAHPPHDAASPAASSGPGKAERSTTEDEGGGEQRSGSEAAAPAAPATQSRASSSSPGAVLYATGRALSATSRSAQRAFRTDGFATAMRALLHTAQFAVAYLVMLLAMYYNGYILISIFVGAFLGAFLFGRGGRAGKGTGDGEATVCCG
jgi:copper transporter 1